MLLPVQTNIQQSRKLRRKTFGVELNSMFTISIGFALFILLALVGLTLPLIKVNLYVHIFLGSLLIIPVVFKTITTGYKILRYYLRSDAYLKKGPPNSILRLLGPFVVILTYVLIISGVLLTVGPKSLRLNLLFIHKASFVLWFGAMTIHVLGHLKEMVQYGSKLVNHKKVPRITYIIAAMSVILSVPLALLLAENTNNWLVWFHHL